MRKIPLSVRLGLVFLSSAPLHALPTFTLGFVPDPSVVACDGVITAQPGSRILLDVVVVLVTSENGEGHGASGWQLSLGGDNLRFVPGSAVNKGEGLFDVPTFFRGDPQVIDPEFIPTEGPLADIPQGEGVVDGVALRIDREFPIEGTENLLRVQIEVTVPGVDEDPVEALLFFADGKQGSGRWVENLVTYQGESINPEFSVCRFTVQAGVFIRGDTDANGLIEITDVVALLSHLFLGREAPSCFDAADVDDDGELNITDAIFGLGYQFLGQRHPPAPGPFKCGPDPTPIDPPAPACVYPPEHCRP